MRIVHSVTAHRLLATIAMLGITAAAYAGHCRNLQFSSNCDADPPPGTINCGTLAFSCPDEPLYSVVPGRVHICVDADSGSTSCDDCGETVFARKQKWKCANPYVDCQIEEDGPPTNHGPGCCSAVLDGVLCAH